ncbi:Nn.00g106800.m01.CDS01 [Neocucurbitaria sp. VM-36]
MGHGKILLTALRVLALMVVLAVVGLGAWSKVIVHDIEIRGSSVLKTARLDNQIQDQYWQTYFTEVLNGVIRIWISIAAASFASLASILIVLATVLDRMRISSVVLIPIEWLSMCAMATAFGTSLSLALSLIAFTEIRLDTAGSADLMNFAMLVPLSKGYAVAAGAGGFLVLVACITSTVDACSRAKAKESCSFEPTASALGMSHGYQAVIPDTPRDRVPTMYDPQRPAHTDSRKAPSEHDEMGFAKEGTEMGRRDSGLSEMGKVSYEVEKQITGPLDLDKPQRVLQIRPSRPWSEAPKRRDGTVHAM